MTSAAPIPPLMKSRFGRVVRIAMPLVLAMAIVKLLIDLADGSGQDVVLKDALGLPLFAWLTGYWFRWIPRGLLGPALAAALVCSVISFFF